MMLPVETVVSNVKFHSNQGKINQSTATNVFQSINHKAVEAQVVVDLAAEVAAEVVAEMVAEVALTEDHEKCTKQPVEIVVKIVRFHSSQSKINQSTVTNAFKVIKETR